MPVKIETILGQLTLGFASINFALGTGQAIDSEAIEKVCDEFWIEFHARANETFHNKHLGRSDKN